MKKYIQYVLRPGTGRTLPQATINVKANPSTLASPNVTIYSDAAGASPIAQPFLSSAAGLVEFYAPDGRYDVYVAYNDISYSLTDLWIFDPTVTVPNLSALGFVTTKAEGLLSGESVMPTFLGHPDTPPTSPNAFDNEFNAADGNWANTGTDANSTITVANGRVRVLQKTTTRTAPAVGYERTSFTPGAQFTLTSLLRFGYHPGTDSGVVTGNTSYFGLGIKDNAGNVTSIGLMGGTQGISVYNVNFNTSGISSSESFQTLGSNSCYVRFRKPTGGDFFLEWSQDGFTWITVKAFASLGTVVRYGLYAYASFDTGGVVDCYSDFARYVTTVPY